jgi:hypothetical protein
MNWAQVLIALIWLAVGLGISAGAHDLGVGTLSSPGPGLFPFVIGVGMAVLSLGVSVTSRRVAAPVQEAGTSGFSRFMPVVAVIVALVFYTFTLERLGFLLSTFLFLSGLLIALGGKNILSAAVAGAGITAGAYLVFAKLLKITLPLGPFGF